MADTWAMTLVWRGGEAQEIGVSIGPTGVDAYQNRMGSQVSSLPGVLRIGFHGDQLPTIRFRARFRLPDNGNVIYPVDLPTVAAIELPCRVDIAPDESLPAEEPVTVELAAVDDTTWYGRYQMGTTLTLPEGVQVALPPWCTAVSLIDNAATATWHNAAGVAIGTFAGADNPRSRLAHFIQSGDAETLAIAHFGA